MKNNSQTKYFIFDFDGVLGDTFELIIEVLMSVLKLDYDNAKDLIIKASYKNIHKNSDLKFNKETKEKILSVFTELTAKKGKLFDGFVKELEQLQNTQMAIVTSSRRLGVEKMLKQAPNLSFDYILTSQENISKVINVNQILNNWDIQPSQAFYFADTISDIDELKDIFNSQNLLGCSWGYHGYEILSKYLPEKQILKQFGDIKC